MNPAKKIDQFRKQRNLSNMNAVNEISKLKFSKL